MDEGSQFPCSVYTTPNASYAEAEPSEDNPADESRYANPVYGDSPPLYSSVTTSGGAPTTFERRPGPVARPAEVVESTRHIASAGHGHLSELAMMTKIN